MANVTNLDWLLASLVIAFGPADLLGQTRASIGDQQPVATVEVLAFDTRGKFLGAPTVATFEAYDRTNFAAKFHAGTAEGIPFGEYRIEAHLPAYSSETRYVRVYERCTTVIVGLTVGYERPTVPLRVDGHVVGKPPKGAFVRLVGVFSNLSVESPIRIDGGFALVGLTWGKYLLLVVGQEGLLATQALTIPYAGPPIEIEIKADSTGAIAP